MTLQWAPMAGAGLQVQVCWSAGVQKCLGCSQPLQLLHGAHLPCPWLLFHQSRSLVGRDPKALYGSFYVIAAVCEHITSVTGKLSPQSHHGMLPPISYPFRHIRQVGIRCCWDCDFPPNLRDSRSLMNLGFQGVLNGSTFNLSVLSLKTSVRDFAITIEFEVTEDCLNSCWGVQLCC